MGAYSTTPTNNHKKIEKMGLGVQYPLPLLTPETVLLPASTTFTEVKTGRERMRSDMKRKPRAKCPCCHQVCDEFECSSYPLNWCH